MRSMEELEFVEKEQMGCGGTRGSTRTLPAALKTQGVVEY